MLLTVPSVLEFSGDSDGGQKRALGSESDDLSSSPSFAPYWQRGLEQATEISCLDFLFIKISTAYFSSIRENQTCSNIRKVLCQLKSVEALCKHLLFLMQEI